MAVRLHVVEGDIVDYRHPVGDQMQQPDSLITFVNANKFWAGGVDYAIRSSGGNSYYLRLGSRDLKNGEVHRIEGSRDGHQGTYNDIIFVVDSVAPGAGVKSIIEDYNWPVGVLLKYALVNAYNSGDRLVVAPAFRCGVMKGVVEKSEEDVINSIVWGIGYFEELHPQADLDLVFVIYKDPELYKTFKQITVQDSAKG